MRRSRPRAAVEVSASGRPTFLVNKQPTHDVLSFFEEPKHAGYGCTVLLFGAPLSELAKVKRVLQRALYVVYHMHLETKVRLARARARSNMSLLTLAV